MKNLEEARKRSVDNLQRLYTVVVSLAVTESLRRLLVSFNITGTVAGYKEWLMFVSLIFTVVPFYHGANRESEIQVCPAFMLYARNSPNLCSVISGFMPELTDSAPVSWRGVECAGEVAE